MSIIEQGCIDIWIDSVVPCLVDTETGAIKETVVFKIESRAYLKKFLKKTVGISIGTSYQKMLKSTHWR